MTLARTARRTALLGAALIIAASAGAQPTLQVSPLGGALTGAPGATVGWGFTITNTTNFAVVTGSSFAPTSVLGNYTDFIGQFQFVVVGPAPETTPVTQSFDNTTHTGVGSFAISAGALPGASAGGTITVTYSLFSVSPNDPTFNPDTDTLVADAELTASVSVSVAGSPAIAKAFGALSVAVGGSTSLAFTLTNPNAFLALTGVAFTDSLPAGLVVSTPNGASGNCGGTVTAVAGSGAISLAGGTLAAGGQCTFSVNVTVTTPGTKVNTTGNVVSTEGGRGGTATAALDGALAIPALGGWGLLALAVVLAAAAVVALRRFAA